MGKTGLTIEEYRNSKKAGRPIAEHTKLVSAAKRKFSMKASRMASRLFLSQAMLANGTHTLMRIDEIVHYRDDGKTDKQGNAVKSRYVERKYEVVTDPEELETVINDFGDFDGNGVVDGKYYFMTHEKPNNQAIDSILSRAWGKPKETVEVIPTGEGFDQTVKEKIDEAVMDYFVGKKPISVEVRPVEEMHTMVMNDKPLLLQEIPKN